MKKNILSIMLFFCSYLSIAQEKEIKAVLEKQRLDWNNGDMIGYMQGYLKSDSLLFVGKTGPFYGWEKNLQVYQQVYPDKAAMGNLTFDIIQIKMIDKKHAFVLGGWNLQNGKRGTKRIFYFNSQKI